MAWGTPAGCSDPWISGRHLIIPDRILFYNHKLRDETITRPEPRHGSATLQK